jgi:hypothetical protein
VAPAEIERGWNDTFSTTNPFCPCDLKSFTKAVRWAESVLASDYEALRARLVAAEAAGELPTPFHYADGGRGEPLFTASQLRAAIAVCTSDADSDAVRWREVSDKAWFVDAAGYAYGLREGSFAPTCDPDDVTAAIDTAIAEQERVALLPVEGDE